MLPRQGSVSRRPGTASGLGVHYSANEAFLSFWQPSRAGHSSGSSARTANDDARHRLLPSRTKPHRRLARGWARYSRPTPLELALLAIPGRQLPTQNHEGDRAALPCSPSVSCTESPKTEHAGEIRVVREITDSSTFRRRERFDQSRCCQHVPSLREFRVPQHVDDNQFVAVPRLCVQKLLRGRQCCSAPGSAGNDE